MAATAKNVGIANSWDELRWAGAGSGAAGAREPQQQAQRRELRSFRLERAAQQAHCGRLPAEPRSALPQQQQQCRLAGRFPASALAPPQPHENPGNG